MRGGSHRVARGGRDHVGHAELTSSTPANQSILASTPPEILLTFTEGVDPVGDSIRLVDAAGDPVPLGPIDQSRGDDTLRAPVPATIADGTYIVGWQAISADSHKIRGAFTFSVGAATPTAPGVLDEIFDAGGTSQSDSLLLGIGRFMSFAGIGVLVGALFLAAVLVPELIGERRVGTLLVAAALTAVVGTALMFAGQSHLISGSYVAWGDVVQIQSGQWWLARLAAIGLFALFIPARSFLASTLGRIEVALAGLVVCGVVAAGGHAVAGDMVVAGFVATVIHLAAMSIWLGGLALLAFGVPRELVLVDGVAVLAVGARRRCLPRGHRQRERMASARVARGRDRFFLRPVARHQAVVGCARRRRSCSSVVGWRDRMTTTSRRSRSRRPTSPLTTTILRRVLWRTRRRRRRRRFVAR